MAVELDPRRGRQGAGQERHQDLLVGAAHFAAWYTAIVATPPAPHPSDLLARARAAWPGFDVPEADLLTRLGRNPEREWTELEVCDIYLACGCARALPAALAAFDAHYLVEVAPALARLRPSGTLVDEVKQILREKLLVAAPGKTARILDLAGGGDLRALVRVAAIRTALNLRRRDERLQPLGDSDVLELLAPDASPALAVMKARHRTELKQAFEDALAALTPRDRNVLRLHLLHGLSIDEIGHLHQVHRATAARWLEKIRGELDRVTRDRLHQRFGVDPTEVESLIRLVQSRLEVSFRRLLDDPPDPGT